MKRRLFSFFLTLLMVLGLIPAVSATGSPALGVKDTDIDNGVFMEHSDFMASSARPVTYSHRISFYYGTQSNHQLLTGITDVSVADPSILSISEWDTADTGEVIYHIDSHKVGQTELIVETVSGTYRTPIAVTMPAFSAYTQPDFDERYLINHDFVYSNSNRTFYLILDYYGFTMADAWVADSGYDHCFNITTTPGGKVAKVEIVNAADLGNAQLSFHCQLADSSGNSANCGTYSMPNIRFVNGTPSLGFVEGYMDGNDFVADSDFETSLEIQYSFGSRVAFCYGTANNYRFLTDITDVYASNPSVIEVELYNDVSAGTQAYRLTGKALGSTTLSVETTSGTYTMPVEVSYPYMGIYTQPVRDLDYFVEDEFAYSAANNVFYFFTSDSNFQMTECYVDNSDFKKNFNITIGPNGAYARVEIIDFTGLDGECPDFRCRGTNPTPNGYTGFGSGYVTFVDGAETIGYVDTWYDNNQLIYDDQFYKQLDLDMGNSTRIAFGYGNSADYNLLTDIVDITSENEKIATVELQDEDGKVKIWRIQSESLGSTWLKVETASGTYRMPINVEMPRLGMFSQPNRKAEYLISREFLYSDSNSSFYLVFEDRDFTISDAWVESSDFVSNFSFTTVNPNCIRVDIVDTDGINGQWINFRCQLADPNGNPSGFGTYGTGIEFLSNNPTIGFSSIRWQGDEIISRDDFQTEFSFGPGGSVGMVFYYGTSASHSILNNITSVTVADPSVATAEYWRDTVDGLPTYEVTFHNVGSTELIIRTADNREYRAPLTVRIYGGYFFTKPQFDTQYVSTSFDITETSNTFYFVTEPGTSVNEVIPQPDFSDVFDISYAKDNSYATIKVVKPEMLPSWSMNIEAELSDTRGNTWTNGYGVQLNNAIPVLMAEYVDFMNGQIYPLGDYITTMDQSLYSRPAFLFHYGTYANSTPITGITSVTLSDPSLATITSETDSSGATAWFLDPQKTGSTTLIVNTSSGTYTMPVTIDFPDLGVYSQPIRSLDTLLRHGVEWTDSNKTFYLMLREPDEFLTSVSASSFNNNFSYTVAGDGSYVKVEIVDTTGLDNAYTDFTANISDSNGGSWQNRVGCSIVNGNDTIGWVDVWYPPSDNLEFGDESYKLLDWWLGDADNITFAYGTHDNYSLLKNVTNITSENTDIITLEWEILADGTVYCVPACVGLGNTHIRIETTTDTYRLPVEVVLPPLAAFTQPTGDPQHMIQEFPFTNINNTFYLMLNVNHATIADIYPEDDSLSGHFRFTFTPGDQYAKVEIIDPEALHDMWIEFRCQLGDANGDPTGLGTFGMRAVHFVDNTPIAPLPNAPVTPIQRPSWSHSGAGLPSDLNEGDQLFVTVPVENKTAADQEITAMLAIYNDSGKMLALRSGTITIPANGSDNVSLDVDLTGIHNADHAKLFMTDGDFLPVSTVFTLT